MAATTALTRATRVQPVQGALAGESRQLVWGIRSRTEQVSNVWILSVFGLLVFTFLIYFHTVLIESQANHKQQEIIKIQEQNANMQARLAELKSLAAVESRATGLGMQPVEQYHYISIDPQLYKSTAPLAVDVSAPRYPVQTPVGF
ncbi:MAG: hypothetical protein ACO1RX_20935 [Candidatus Sericytochromatia bacterium]